MPPRVVFIHTVHNVVDLFKTLSQEIIPRATALHIADDCLIRAVLAAGGLTPEIHRRVCDHVVAAAAGGADLIQVTCSSISPCVDVARNMVSVPVLKIDEPLADQAVRRYKRIGLIATAPTTLRPSAQLVRDKARELGRQVEVESVLCAGAYDAFFAGDLPRHDHIVREHLRGLMQKVEVVLLAQVSMARVAEAMEEKDRIVPILSTPRPALEHLADLLKEIEQKNEVRHNRG